MSLHNNNLKTNAQQIEEARQKRIAAYQAAEPGNQPMQYFPVMNDLDYAEQQRRYQAAEPGNQPMYAPPEAPAVQAPVGDGGVQGNVGPNINSYERYMRALQNGAYDEGADKDLKQLVLADSYGLGKDYTSIAKALQGEQFANYDTPEIRGLREWINLKNVTNNALPDPNLFDRQYRPNYGPDYSRLSGIDTANAFSQAPQQQQQLSITNKYAQTPAGTQASTVAATKTPEGVNIAGKVYTDKAQAFELLKEQYPGLRDSDYDRVMNKYQGSESDRAKKIVNRRTKQGALWRGLGGGIIGALGRY